MSETNWAVAKPAAGQVRKISAKLGILPITAGLLVNRGITSPEEAELFFSSTLSDLPSPFLMKGMEEAVARLKKSVLEKERVAVYGDYDADGITATCLLVAFLRDLGCDVVYYIPERSEGYGLNLQALGALAEKRTALVISVDCGVTSVEEVAEAGRLGMDFIVTDHHSLGDRLPDAVSVLNPHREDCRYPGKELSGVGVAFNLAMGLRRTLREEGFFGTAPEPNLGDFLDLVSIGTVCDHVPVRTVNRIMLKEGLKRMRNPKRPGLRALKKVSRLGERVGASDLGFRLGPRINAAGRLDSASRAVELLLAGSYEEALPAAEFLDEINGRRSEIERRMMQEASVMAESSYEKSNSLVLASREWHRGVVGIVASGAARKYGKPAFLISVDEHGVGTGSGRSFGGIDILSVLRRCGDLLDRFGGHAAAAGMALAEEKIDLFREKFSRELEKSGQKPERKVDVDSEISLASVDDVLFSEIERLSPFGVGNPAPVFLARSLEVVHQVLLKDAHLKFRVKQNGPVFDCIWFDARTTELPRKIDLLFSLRPDEKRTRLFVKDAREAQPPS